MRIKLSKKFIFAYDQDIESLNFLQRGIYKSNKIRKYNYKNSGYYAQIMMVSFHRVKFIF